MSRLETVQKIYERLARLETELSKTKFNSQEWKETSLQIDALRAFLKDVMNHTCPVVRSFGK